MVATGLSDSKSQDYDEESVISPYDSLDEDSKEIEDLQIPEQELNVFSDNDSEDAINSDRISGEDEYDSPTYLRNKK